MSYPKTISSTKVDDARSDSTEEFLPFTRPSIDAKDIREVIAVLESGWITTGAVVKRLEAEIQGFNGSECAVAVTSATAGMHIVLHALGIGPGDEVITPSLTWVSTVNLIVLSGATPVFVDVEKNSLMTNAKLVERAITPRTKLIIPVHFAGAPLDLQPLRTLAANHGIPMVEDAAHALGSEYGKEPVGRTGTAIFSFQAIKNITTAEGGMICTDNADLAERLRRLRFHGLGADAFDRETQGRVASAEVIEPGYKYNLPDMNACLALGQLKRLNDMNRRRAELANRYLRAFADIEEITPLERPKFKHRHAWHLFIVRVDTDKLNIDRAEFMNALKVRNIGSGLHFRSVHSQKFYRERFGTGVENLENTDWNSDRIVTLPLFPAMTDADIDRVVHAVKDIVLENAK